MKHRLIITLLIVLTFVLFFNCSSCSDDDANTNHRISDDSDDDIADGNSMDDDEACPPGMVMVPGGKTVVQYYGPRWDGLYEESVVVEDFCIDIYEASQPDASEDFHGSWSFNDPIPNAESKPGVLPWVSISWLDAQQACMNVGKRLPTLAEWQTAFSDLEGLLWPWGDEWEDNDCYVDWPTFGSHPTGGCCFEICPDSECFSVCDFVGNVSEWVDGYWDESCYGSDFVMIAGGSAHLNHSDMNGQQEDPDKPGCWLFEDYSLPRSGLHHHDQVSGFEDDGFRCAASID